MTDVLDDAATALAGVTGGVTGWALYKGRLPPQADVAGVATENVVALFLYDAGNRPDMFTATPASAPRGDVTFQLRVRSLSYATARNMAQACRDLLAAGITNSIYCYPVGTTPVPFRDENERPNFTWSFRTRRDI